MIPLKIKPDEKKIPITTNVYPSDLKLLGLLAEHYDCSKASLITQLIEHFVLTNKTELEKKKGKQNV